MGATISPLCQKSRILDTFDAGILGGVRAVRAGAAVAGNILLVRVLFRFRRSLLVRAAPVGIV